MSYPSTNLGLTIWNAANDQFDWAQLAANFLILDGKFTPAGEQIFSNVPIRYIEKLPALPVSDLNNGRLVYLDTANGGFSANTIVQYRNSQWYEVGQPEIVTAKPVSNHYLGRVIVFGGNATDGSGFVKGDVAVCTDISGSGTYSKIGGGGVPQYTTIANAVLASLSAGQLALLTNDDATKGSQGGPYLANTLIVKDSSGYFKPIANVPPGVIHQYVGTDAPYGWLLCDGKSDYLKSDYPNLSAVLAASTPTYPFGSDATHFSVPDLRGRVPVGKGTHADVDAIGDNEGIAYANAAYRRPKHQHTPHSHIQNTSTVYDNQGGGGRYASTNQTGDPGSGFSLSTATKDGGSGNANDSIDAPAYIVLNYIIKV
jgi:hypothetical protein